MRVGAGQPAGRPEPFAESLPSRYIGTFSSTSCANIRSFTEKESRPLTTSPPIRYFLTKRLAPHTPLGSQHRPTIFNSSKTLWILCFQVYNFCILWIFVFRSLSLFAILNLRQKRIPFWKQHLRGFGRANEKKKTDTKHGRAWDFCQKRTQENKSNIIESHFSNVYRCIDVIFFCFVFFIGRRRRIL